MRSLFGKFISPLLFLAIIFFICNAYITYTGISHLKTNDVSIAQEQEVSQDLQKTLNLLVDAETGQRGYLSTWNSLYLAPYTNALPLIPEEIARVKTLTHDNVVQQKNVAVLSDMTQQRLALLKKGIILLQNSQNNSEEFMQEEAEGKFVMDRIRVHIATMQEKQHQILDEREQLSQRNYTQIYTMIVITTIFSILLVIASYILLRKELEKREQLKKAAEAKEQQLALIADAMPQQVWTATPQGALDYVNIQTTKYFGKSEKKIIGDGWQKVIHPEDLPACIKHWTHVLKTGKPYEVEFRLRAADGKYRWHLARATAVKTHGVITKWIGTNTDIEEKKHLERQKNDFVSIATHELKTPVTSVKAFAEVLQRKFLKSGDALSASQLGKMNAQMDKLTSLIGDMLDATKIDSGQLRMDDDFFAFDPLVTEILEELQRTTTFHKILIHGHTNKKIRGDRERIGQVLTNLVSNAIKYSPNSQKINVDISYIKGCVQVCVQDFGVGIPKEKQKKVFERFYRVSGPKENTFPGLGLGLYISSEIMKRQNGKIWVESDGKNGSTFCFSLPIKKSSNTNLT